MSNNDFVLEAQPREDVGKGASRRLRKNAESVPAIIYGADKDPVNISLLHKDIAHAIENEAFFSHLITIKIGKKAESCVIKDLQRHPAKPQILHADFMRVSADHAITVKVPLHLINDDKCVGVKQNGGVVIHHLTELEVSCLPKDLPEFIEIDILNLDVGESLHISDLTLPKGISSVDLARGEDGNHAVVSIHVAKAAEVDEPEAAEDDDSKSED